LDASAKKPSTQEEAVANIPVWPRMFAAPTEATRRERMAIFII
jgi:hypothetical protein